MLWMDFVPEGLKAKTLWCVDMAPVVVSQLSQEAAGTRVKPDLLWLRTQAVPDDAEVLSPRGNRCSCQRLERVLPWNRPRKRGLGKGLCYGSRPGVPHGALGPLGHQVCAIRSCPEALLSAEPVLPSE